MIFRKDKDGRLIPIANSIIQRFNDRIFTTTHSVEEGADYYEIDPLANKYITGLTDFTEFQLYINTPNETPTVKIRFNGEVLTLNVEGATVIPLGGFNGRQAIFTLNDGLAHQVLPALVPAAVVEALVEAALEDYEPDFGDLSNFYNKPEVNTLLEGKLNYVSFDEGMGDFNIDTDCNHRTIYINITSGGFGTFPPNYYNGGFLIQTRETGGDEYPVQTLFSPLEGKIYTRVEVDDVWTTWKDHYGDNVALKVNTSDIVDDLTSTDVDKPLSANQGKVLQDNKVDKVANKGLSTNDYTTTEKTKLSGIATGAQVNPSASAIKTQYESNANTNAFTDTEKTKLTGIAAGAQVNPTATQVKVAYESNANTNAFTDDEKDKLASLESSKFVGQYISLAQLQAAHPTALVGSYAYVDPGLGSDVIKYIWDSNDTKWVISGEVNQELTAAQVKVLYEDNADTNAFTDTEKDKLSGIETGAEVNEVNSVNGQTGAVVLDAEDVGALPDDTPIPTKLSDLDNDEGFVKDSDLETTLLDYVEIEVGKGLSTNDYTTTEKNKLSGIEAGAEVNLTPAQIKTAYESNANTRAFTDTEKSKLSNIQSGAQVNPTSAQTKIAYESNADTNAFTDDEKDKLESIEAGAEVNEVNSVNSQTGVVEINADDIPFNGTLTNYLTDKSQVQAAIRELDIKVKANADDVALDVSLKENKANKITNLDTPNNTTFPTTLAVKTYVDTLVGNTVGSVEHDIILISDTAFTITQAHHNKTLIITSSSNVTITVPTQIVEDIEKGFFCDIVRYGTGEVTFSGTGIVLNSAGALSIDAQYIASSLIKIDNNNEWLLLGGRS